MAKMPSQFRRRPLHPQVKSTTERAVRTAMLEHTELHMYAEHLLGPGAWSLLRTFGRVMSGQYSGLCVSGLPVVVARDIVDALVRGELVDVHLMRRHVSGDYESSQTAFDGTRLVMRFDDRSEPA